MTFWCGSGSGPADPCLYLMDPDPGGPKTCGSGGSGSGFGSGRVGLAVGQEEVQE